MAKISQLWLLPCVLVMGCTLLWGQVEPVPIPGGDLITPFGLFNQFFPGPDPAQDGLYAEPQGITNFRGLVAMGYAIGTATDKAGRTYNVVTDVRVYQGDYIGAEFDGGAGRTKSARARGTFVEI